MKSEQLPKEEIEARAYELYLDCGCSSGHDLEHWLTAEEEVRQKHVEEPTPLKYKTAVARLRSTG